MWSQFHSFLICSVFQQTSLSSFSVLASTHSGFTVKWKRQRQPRGGTLGWNDPQKRTGQTFPDLLGHGEELGFVLRSLRSRGRF